MGILDRWNEKADSTLQRDDHRAGDRRLEKIGFTGAIRTLLQKQPTDNRHLVCLETCRRETKMHKQSRKNAKSRQEREILYNGTVPWTPPLPIAHPQYKLAHPQPSDYARIHPCPVAARTTNRFRQGRRSVSFSLALPSPTLAHVSRLSMAGPLALHIVSESPRPHPSHCQHRKS